MNEMEKAHGHSHGEEVCHEEGCGCALDGGGCGCSHCHIELGGQEEEPSVSKKNITLLIISAALFFISILFPLVFKDFGGSGVQALVFLASTLLAGYELFWTGLKSLIHLKFDENVLLFIAVIASFALGEYPEACIVTILFQLGEFLEDAAIRRSRRSMEKLTEIRPDYAYIKQGNGSFEAIPAENAAIGDIVWLRAGDKAALDCEIIGGKSSLDASALTGEAVPVNVSEGDEVMSGSVNLTGLLECRVTKTFENSTASQIINLVYDSVKKKGRTEAFITRFAKVYTPIVILLAVIIALFPPLFGLGSWHDFIMRSLIFLVASCPCALVISIPFSFFSAIGANAKIGVLIKGSKYIEILSKVKAVCFDKTGTLTSGRLKVDEAVTVSNYTKRCV